MRVMIGYVVIEWNQASGRPRVMDDSFSSSLEHVEALKEAYEDILPLARKETYSIGVVTPLKKGETL